MVTTLYPVFFLNIKICKGVADDSNADQNIDKFDVARDSKSRAIIKALSPVTITESSHPVGKSCPFWIGNYW